MKSVSGTEIISEQDKVRKSLHELQPSAINKETLVGADRMIKSTQQVKEVKEIKSKKNVPTKKKKEASKNQIKANSKTVNNKTVQTELQGKRELEAEDLTNVAGPSENYWQIIAEKRRIALEDVLEKNKDLTERLEKLEEEKRIYKEMLDETRALVEVLQDMMEDDNDRNDINNSLEDSVL